MLLRKPKDGSLQKWHVINFIDFRFSQEAAGEPSCGFNAFLRL